MATREGRAARGLAGERGQFAGRVRRWERRWVAAGEGAAPPGARGPRHWGARLWVRGEPAAAPPAGGGGAGGPPGGHREYLPVRVEIKRPRSPVRSDPQPASKAARSALPTRRSSRLNMDTEPGAGAPEEDAMPEGGPSMEPEGFPGPAAGGGTPAEVGGQGPAGGEGPAGGGAPAAGRSGEPPEGEAGPGAPPGEGAPAPVQEAAGAGTGGEALAPAEPAGAAAAAAEAAAPAAAAAAAAAAPGGGP